MLPTVNDYYTRLVYCQTSHQTILLACQLKIIRLVQLQHNN